MSPDRSHAMDHVVLVLFENRSLDNMLGVSTGRMTAGVYAASSRQSRWRTSGAPWRSSICLRIEP